MKIADLSINRAVTFTMIFIGVIAFGLVSLGRLNPELFPNVTFPAVTVITSYTGVGSEDLEKLIARPIEGAISTITGVKEVMSTCKEGQSITIVKFDWGTNMDVASSDIRERLDLIKSILPKDASDPLIFKFDVSLQPIMFIGISSNTLTSAELRKMSEDDISPIIERIDGVASVSTRGGEVRQIQVQVDRNKLEAHELSVQAVMGVIAGENITSPAGEIDEDKSTKLIRTVGEFTSVDQIGKIVVSYKDGAPVYVRDVASVVDTYADQTDQVYFNSKPVVTFMVQKQADANTVKVVDRVNKSLKELQNKYEGRIKFDVIMDSSQYIKDSLNNVYDSAIQGGLLAVLVLFFFLYNVRSVLIISTAIPISIIATFSIMDFAGVSLNIISMAGLALGIGMLVDDAIVVLENTYRHREEGEDRRKAASNGTAEVAIAVIASTLTTLAVFVPVIFVPGIAGVLFKDQALTVSFSLTASLFVAFTLVPLLASRYLKLGSEGKQTGQFHKLTLKLESYKLGLDKFYRRLLSWALDHRKTVLIVVLIMFLSSVSLFYPFRLIGTEFAGMFDQGEIQLNIETTPGTRLEVTEDAAIQADKVIHEVAGDDIKSTYITVGSGEGLSALFGGTGSNAASIRVEVKNVNERKRSQNEIELDIKDHLVSIPGIKIVTGNNIAASILGMGGSDINIEVYGYDRETARELSDKIKTMVENVKGTADVQTSLSDTTPELKVAVDRDKAYALGLNVATIASTLQTDVLGTVASRFREGSDEYDILVRYKKDDRLTREDIYNTPIMSPMMSQVQLRNVASIQPSQGSISIDRKKQERIVTVTGKLRGRDLGSVTRDIQAGLRAMALPPGFIVSIGGSASDMAESFRWLGYALIGALFLVYAVMASLYESLITPFIIMFTFPLGIIGVAWLFFFTGTTFSLMAFIGFIVLAGIVVKNGIVMIDYVGQLRDRGLSLREATMKGAETRLRPILMTSLTTVFGMTPLALGLGAGAEMSFPLARAVVGGLSISTILTLLFLPVLYTIISGYRIKRTERKSMKKAQHTSIAVGE
jgi:HAE1 family hydrophobic/amphiphilic exporter-1